MKMAARQVDQIRVQRMSANIACLFLLMLAAAYYCHRFYGIDFALEGDAPLNVYFRLNQELVLADHNPFQWGYSSFMPFSGINNPVLYAVSAVVDSFGPLSSEVARAIYINMLASWVYLCLLSWSIFWFLALCGCSLSARMLGAFIVSYTGFHALVGVREFDHMYLMSFVFSAPVLISSVNICRRRKPLIWTLVAAVCIGLSLLGGSNVPMFYYIPFFFLLPLFQVWQQKGRYCFRGEAGTTAPYITWSNNWTAQGKGVLLAIVLIAFGYILNRHTLADWMIVDRIRPVWTPGQVDAIHFLQAVLIGGGLLTLALQYRATSARVLRAMWLEKLPHSILSLACAVGLGALIAAPVLAPGKAFLSETNRQDITFSGGVKPQWTIATMFIRGWWFDYHKAPHYHEIDFFIGLPALILAAVGIWLWLRDDSYSRRLLSTSIAAGNSREVDQLLLARFMITCLVAGVLIAHVGILPKVLSEPVAWFYESLSIRNPNRFFLLALLPISYFAARGFDAFRGRICIQILGVAVVLCAVLIIGVPVQRWTQMLPDDQLAALLSLSCAFLATGLLALRWRLKRTQGQTWRIRLASALCVMMVFGVYLFAPNQLTVYSSWYVRHGLHNNLPANRLEVANVLGLSSNYKNIVETASSTFLSSPSILAQDKSRIGRIFDDRAEVRDYYFAPRTKHRFAFDDVYDTASSKRIKELYDLKNDAVFDLYGICWVIRNSPGPWHFVRGKSVPYTDPRLTQVLEQRTSCLPMHYLVTQIQPTSSDAEVLQHIGHASRSDFLKQVFVNCAEVSCTGLPGTGIENGSSQTDQRQLRLLEDSPGKMKFEVAAGAEAILFVSTPFHPAWRAEISGNPVRLLRANHAFLAVPLGSERAIVTLKLVQDVRNFSILVSWCTLIVIGLIFLVALFRDKLRAQRPQRVVGAWHPWPSKGKVGPMVCK
jgi:hypothetical protein